MFKPFDQKPKDMEKMIMNWKELYPKPYSKNDIDPYTRNRIILMNGIETEAAFFSHNFHRQCEDMDLRKDLAKARRMEQQQQKMINWLSPGDETQLETTIGYEQVAVDLTAWLAQHEPDDYVVQCLDFALLEDFDHLYRYANLLKMDKDIPAHDLVEQYVEITPGRPTIAHHRYPTDTVRKPGDFKKADDQTKLNTMIITAGEQQTMNFYANMGPTYENDPGRKLYQEIGMVEEDHVTHYGSLLDPTCSWLENLLLHDYVEVYLYYSFMEDEKDKQIKPIWEMFLEIEIAHLHKAAELLKKYEGKEWKEIVTGEIKEPLKFENSKEYVRKVLENQIELSAKETEFVDVHDLDKNSDFAKYQEIVNKDVNNVTSHTVIRDFQKENGEDYRYEDKESPVKALRDRENDNYKLGRIE